jgi:hypothetical protein
MGEAACQERKGKKNVRLRLQVKLGHGKTIRTRRPLAGHWPGWM